MQTKYNKKQHVSPNYWLKTFTCLGLIYSPLLWAGFGLDNANLSNVDTSKWRCKFCPNESGVSGTVEGYFGYSDEATSQRFKNTDAEAQSGQASLSADIDHYQENQRSRITLHNLGNEDVDAQLAVKNDADLNVEAGYSRSNHFFGEAARTPYQDPRADDLTLPSSWVTQTNTTAMDFSNTNRINNYLQRETLETSIKNKLADDALAYSIHFRQQNRSGDRWKSGSILNDVSFLPYQSYDSLNELTANISIPLSFSEGSGRFGLEYFNSVYDNDRESLTWDNPFDSGIPGTEEGRLALSPDNEFKSWRYYLQYSLDKHVFEFSYSQGKGEQDDAFLPYTSNPNLLVSALPQQSYEGEVDTRQARLRWDYRINPEWHLKTRYRMNERKNISDSLTYDPVITDSLLTGAVDNPRYSHKKNELEVNLDWRLRSKTRLGYEFEYDTFKRSQESTGQYHQYGLAFYWKERWAPDVQSHIRFLSKDRDEKNPEDSSSSNDNPLYRDFTVADRLRNGAEFSLDWQMNEAVQYSMNVDYQHDDYENTQVGLTESEEHNFGMQLTWTPRQNLNTFASLQRGWISWMLSGSSQFTVPTWGSDQDDVFDVFSLGIEEKGLRNNTVGWGAIYTYVYSEGNTEYESGQQYAPLRSQGHALQAHVSYRWRPEWEVRLESRYERYESRNPALVAIDALPKTMSAGIEDDNYADWLIGMRLTYDIPRK